MIKVIIQGAEYTARQMVWLDRIVAASKATAWCKEKGFDPEDRNVFTQVEMAALVVALSVPVGHDYQLTMDDVMDCEPHEFSAICQAIVDNRV